jgi:hypothetical protein
MPRVKTIKPVPAKRRKTAVTPTTPGKGHKRRATDQELISSVFSFVDQDSAGLLSFRADGPCIRYVKTKRENGEEAGEDPQQYVKATCLGGGPPSTTDMLRHTSMPNQQLSCSRC